MDLIWTVSDRIHAAEIKAGATFRPESLAGLDILCDRLGDAVIRRSVVYDGEGPPFEQSETTVVTPRHFPAMLDSWESA